MVDKIEKIELTDAERETIKNHDRMIILKARDSELQTAIAVCNEKADPRSMRMLDKLNAERRSVRDQIFEIEEKLVWDSVTRVMDSFGKLSFQQCEDLVNLSDKTGYRVLSTKVDDGGSKTITLRIVLAEKGKPSSEPEPVVKVDVS